MSCAASATGTAIQTREISCISNALNQCKQLVCIVHKYASASFSGSTLKHLFSFSPPLSHSPEWHHEANNRLATLTRQSQGSPAAQLPGSGLCPQPLPLDQDVHVVPLVQPGLGFWYPWTAVSCCCAWHELQLLALWLLPVDWECMVDGAQLSTSASIQHGQNK